MRPCVVSGHTLFRTLLALAFLSGRAVADSDLDCKTPITVEKLEYDLSSLSGEQTVKNERSTPPSTMIDTVRFNLCGNIGKLDKISQQDQCGDDTRACLTRAYKKGSDKEDVISVVQLANSKKLDPKYAPKTSPQGLEITLHGETYAEKAQSLRLTLYCSPDSSSDHPTFQWYDGSVMAIDWNTTAGCGHTHSNAPPKDDDKKDSSKPSEEVGSGIGYFFLVILIVLAAYFGFGAYYNYSTYGARGWDLVPHRDFWREVPYMLQDVLSHLCSSVRPRATSSRGGYVSV